MIDDQWVMTAAHNVKFDGKVLPNGTVRVRATPQTS